MSSRPPFLSAIICTRDRPALLGPVLASLSRQTLPRGEFEIVVVDHGSTQDAAEVARSFEPTLPLTYARLSGAGAPAARNLGVASARGEILLFLDDADVPEPGLLEAHAAAHRRRPEPDVAVLGYTRLDPKLASDPLMHFVTQVACFLFSYPTIPDAAVLDFTYFWCGRSSCKRSLLVDHGTFDPAMQFGADDIELGFRLSKHGLKVVFEREAVSNIVRRMTFDEFCAWMESRGRSSFLFSRLHPEDAVQRWAEVNAAVETWRLVGPVYDLLRKSGRELDRIARMRLDAGLGLDGTDAQLLYRGYWSAFQASRMKGIVEMAAESGESLAARADATA